ncbi:MAG: hypothetical protein A2887_04200 [Alphaproteobacteria bacterium RIFCSPLOWO2_01_FULL_40_26]|nr:MAG: hypothetical protein A3D15_05510 [Alphaproteobacteria bacterium RIFCSPHIGHO2_02_FULL_40_34]OFW88809.1 MAG: hypothetical protein A2794_04570 [Alphaproteobacteria bacterium RIFCSPHIGHO2_01_FULL_40_8]OFW94427.1 MAG: hypothetical protein A2887_04200 [Alphaproteobacteria bacterium RIFCSPLOWO2_01_FULL_40_26]OFX09388.1 MAG: hypothetical protein A3H30_01885 [Alphaproteobacteria bacterium RIFCSPLOWO2_02_FULL_40_19]OFX11320.1 MAG: hypothetical protein A3G22_02740 [Alphaproteobacteria bacterium RI
MRFFLLLLLTLQLSSCRWFTGAGTTFFAWTNIKVPDGTPTFQQGFKDGCSTVLYARGNVYYRTRYSYRYDPKMIGNPEYRFGHSRGYTWCFQHMLQGQTGSQSSADKWLSQYGKQPMFDMAPADLGKAWGGMFDGLKAPGNPVASANPQGTDSGLDILQKGISGGEAGAGGTVFGGHPLWAGESSIKFMGIW